jgi:hypothetical protein
MEAHMDLNETRPWKVLDPGCALNANVVPEPWSAAFCVDAGRPLLLAELEFGEWVQRRTERVDFVRDRSVTRRTTIELNVRQDAPIFRDLGGQAYWLVPLSLMRRKTLVNLKLEDEQHRPLNMPGIRLTQQLDQSILLAAAATEPHLLTGLSSTQVFVQRLVAGDRQEVLKCQSELESPGPDLRTALKNKTFKAALHEFRLNFTLYVFLRKKEGRRRVVTMSFDEPTDWSYQRPQLNKEKGEDGVWAYKTGKNVSRFSLTRIASAIGWKPMRVRFQIPAAENTGSYHFELIAPHGVQIVKATLLAGRPNAPTECPSVDHIKGHAPVVALHAIEIPHGSLCRAQVDLRIRSGGWLTTMLWCCLAVSVVLWFVAVHRTLWQDSNVVRDVVVLLVATSAAVATLVVERESSGAAARLVTKLRLVGAAVALLPISVAGFLVYGMVKGPHPREQQAIRGLFILALILTVLTFAAWVRSWWDERHNRSADDSPWDQTNEKPPRMSTSTDVMTAIKKYKFDKPAIGIRSSEGWHELYEWTEGLQSNAVTALNRPSPSITHSHWCAVFPTPCNNKAADHQGLRNTKFPGPPRSP